MRIGVSGTHGVGKSTLAAGLRECLPDHVVADEPYDVLVERGHEFGFPPSTDDLRVLIEFTVRSLVASRDPHVIFDRTPLDYLAYLTALGADPADAVAADPLRAAFATVDILVIVPISAAADALLPAPALPALRSAANDALLTLAYDDPFDAWPDTPILELDAPLPDRLGQALRAIRQIATDTRSRTPTTAAP